MARRRAYDTVLRAYRLYRLFSSPERVRMRRTVRRWVRDQPDAAWMLEIGGGTSVLRPMVERDLPAVRYVSTDIAPTNSTDVVADAMALPVRDRSVDTVLALEVLEHMPRPERMLAEACRVLKDDGVLILTTPFMFGEHDYHDYFRYTPRGMAELLSGAGMRLEEVVLRGGSFVSALGLLRNLVRDSIVGQPGGWRAHGRRKKLLWAVATVVMVPWVPVMYAALALDRLVDRDSRSAPGYFFRCRKDEPARPGSPA